MHWAIFAGGVIGLALAIYGAYSMRQAEREFDAARRAAEEILEREIASRERWWDQEEKWR
jgi:hypothetical protein